MEAGSLCVIKYLIKAFVVEECFLFAYTRFMCLISIWTRLCMQYLMHVHAYKYWYPEAKKKPNMSTHDKLIKK